MSKLVQILEQSSGRDKFVVVVVVVVVHFIKRIDSLLPMVTEFSYMR